MSSLSVHLRLPEDHSSLPFHPSCPTCRRDRLAGSLGSDQLISRRTQATFAAGALAWSGMAAPVAVASGPDEVIEGTTETVEGSDPGVPDFGETTSLDDAEAEVPDDEDVPAVIEPEESPLEPEVVQGDAGRVIEASEQTVDPVVEPTPAPEPVAVAAPPNETPTGSTKPERVGAVAPRPENLERTKRERPGKRLAKPVPRRVVAAPAPVVPPPPVPATAEVAPPAAVRVVAGTGTTADQASPGDRFHVVQRGESLWSIAAEVLGERASVGRIAREVNRLWALNEDRIGSGDPDLLYAGTRLRLR
jgi:nucleoid-associated protein YgaU